MTPYEQLKKLCALKPAPGKMLIVCPDVVRRSRALEYALNTLSSGMPNIATQKLDASSLTLDSIRDLRDSSMTLSLFSAQKFIVIKNIDKAPAAVAKDLETILGKKDATNTYICTAASVNQRTAAAKAFDKDVVVNFPVLEGEEIIQWTAQELKRQGLAATENKVVRIIAAMGSEDLDQINSLIEKLVLYCDGDKVCTEDVQALDTFKEKVQEFNFVNLLASNKRTASLAYVEQLNKSESNVFPLLGLLSKMFSNYLRLKLAKTNRHSDAEASRDLGLAPWAFKKQSEIAQSSNEVKLIRAIKAITRADSQIKNKNLGESSVLVELVSNAS